MKLLLLAIAPALFAGCVTSEVAPQPEADSAWIFQAECNGVFYARLVPFPELAIWLPPGYEGADASTILDAAGYGLIETNRGFMAAFGNDCGSHMELHFGILVEPPNIDAPSDPDAIHWYELATFFDNFSLTDSLLAADFPIEKVNVTLIDVNIGPVFRGKVFEAMDAFSGDLVLDLTTFGSLFEFDINGPFYTWHASGDGTQLLIADVAMVASVGDGNCHSEYAWIVDFVGDCERAQPDTLYGRVNQVQLIGEYFTFPGIFAR